MLEVRGPIDFSLFVFVKSTDDFKAFKHSSNEVHYAKNSFSKKYIQFPKIKIAMSYDIAHDNLS